MEAPQCGHGWEVEAQPQLEAYEGDEGDLPHEGAVLRPVRSEGGGQVAGQDEPHRPPEDVRLPPAGLLEEQGAQHDGHHEGGEYLPQGDIFLTEALVMRSSV